MSAREMSYTSRALSEADGVRPTVTSTQKPDLAEFVAAHQMAFREAMAGALRGRGDVDDALQQAYLRLLAEYDRWPTDLTDEERLAFAYRAVHLAAKDVLRQAFGRSDRAPRPREIPVDFSRERREDAETTDEPPVRLLAQQVLTDRAGRHPGDDEHLDTALKVAALAALDPVAHKIVTASRLGLNHKQIAHELGLTHQTVRAKDSEARALLFSLIACAQGREITEATDVNLFGYLEGQKLSRAERRLAQRHLKHCASCQQIAALNGEVDALAQRLVLPLPLLLGGPAVLSNLMGAKLAALASSRGRGSSVTAPAGTSGLGGPFSVGTGKLATGLGIVVLAGTGTTAVVARRDHDPRSAHTVASAAPTNGSVGTHVPRVAPAATFSPPRSTKRHPHRRRHPAHRRLVHHASRSAPAVAEAPTPPAPAPVTSATTRPAAPGQPRASSGGEFVIGGGR